MITEEKLAEFKKGQDYIPLPNWTISEICDTLSALWRVAKAAEAYKTNGYSKGLTALDDALIALRSEEKKS